MADAALHKQIEQNGTFLLHASQQHNPLVYAVICVDCGRDTRLLCLQPSHVLLLN